MLERINASGKQREGRRNIASPAIVPRNFIVALTRILFINSKTNCAEDAVNRSGVEDPPFANHSMHFNF